MEPTTRSPQESGRSAQEETRHRLQDHPLIKAGRLSMDDLAAVETCGSLAGSLEERLGNLGLSEGWVSKEETLPFIELEALDQPDPEVLRFTDDLWAEYRSTAPIGWEGPFLRVVQGGYTDVCGLLELQLKAGAPLRRFMA